MDEEEEYKKHAEALKDEGNEAFQSGNVELAIKLFTQAIDIDPDNHVYYSNRSAAYMKVDSKGKALKDAEKCVELAPTWSKGYNRLGVALQSLKRFYAAIDTLKKGIEIDPENKILWQALKSCQEAYETDKKHRFANAAIERAVEEQRLKRQDEIKQEIAIEKAKRDKKDQDEKTLSDFFDKMTDEVTLSNEIQHDVINETIVPNEPNNEEDNLLASFFSEVTSSTNNVATKKNEALKTDDTLIVEDEAKTEAPSITEKYTNQDLGSSKSQFERILGKHYKWKNLNPYHVLQLDIDATDEDIKYRYRKLSLKVHPDRLRGVENARDAFEQVKDAYVKLCDEVQKKNIVSNIEMIREEVTKEWRRLVNKGISEKDLPNLDDEIEKNVMKHFAEMEAMRIRSEKNIRSYNAREKMQAAEETEKNARFAEFDTKWSEENRRDKRIGNWREFQVDPEAKKLKPSSSFKEESRNAIKHGVSKLETWKKSWR